MKLFLAICFVLLQFNVLEAQELKKFFNSSKVTVDFVGLDFSNVQLVGAEGFTDPPKIQNYYFPVWNGLLLSEISKYDVKGAFYKDNVTYELEVVEAVNEEVEYIDLVTNSSPKSFTDQEIQKIVRAYGTKNLQSDFGLTFIVHSLNKLQERAYIYVVIFNPKTKKVLFSERMSGEARGFGFRNYWAGAVYDIIKQIKKGKFRSWRKSFQ
ncbi:MAG: hypothetical protein ACRBFS_17260 [Aureispira sp.]